MKNIGLLVSIACGSAVLQGCALTNPPSAQWKVEPFQSVRHATARPDGYYRLGRYYQDQNRLAPAANAYHKALAIDPDFVEARNGLATVLALQGKHAQALAEFNALLARRPDAAHIHNNIGYLHLLMGNHAAAAGALAKAAALDPTSRKARDNLALALANENAPTDVRPVAAPTPSSLPQPFAVLAQPNPQAMPLVLVAGKPFSDTPFTPGNPSSPVPANSAEADKNTQSDSVAATDLSHAAIPAAQPNVKKFAFEVSNGNGTRFLAAQIGSMFSVKGLPKAALTNHKPFNQARTVIQYRKGYRLEAERIGKELGEIHLAALMVENKALPSRTDVKLILGKDLSSKIGFLDQSRPLILAAR